MEPSILHSQVNTFQESNTFLYFVLGLISISNSFMHHLETEQDKLNVHPEQQSESSSDEPSARHLRDILI
jgi:hypothetical protein